MDHRPAQVPPWQLRPWQAGDSTAALTALLHRAFAPLAAAGMNFTAASQTEQATRERLSHCHCWVVLRAEHDDQADPAGQILGSVTVNGAYDPNRQVWARATPWFYRDDVAHLHQLAVEPTAQGQGIGAALMQACEQWALQSGHRAIALDTAMPAGHLRQRYQRQGFAEVASVQWDGKAYRSVVMVKPLGQAPVTDQDPAHRAAIVRSFWAQVQARDWAGARALLADQATLHWPASGEHFLDADAIIRVNAIYPEGWALRIQQVTPLVDGRVHSMVEVVHDKQRFLAHTLWRFDGRLIVQADETWATVQAPPAWRTAEAIGAYRRDA